MFVVRDLKAPLSEVAWSKFVARNDENLPDKATWQEWKRFPDHTGCFRFVGSGKPQALDTIRE